MDNKFIQYLDHRINRWVNYYSKDNFYGIGFSDRSLIHHLMVEGIVISSTAPKLMGDEDAEEIESMVCEMNFYNSKMATALRLHYFHSNKSQFMQAQELNISKARFRSYVEMAYQWLAGRLFGIYDAYK